MTRTILTVFAHPDDEAFGAGGTLARYAAEGHRVLLLCTTRGESGLNRLDPDDRDRMGELREEELRRACEQLGIEPPLFLDYRDSGMAGTPENEHPQALHQADPEEVAQRVLAIIQAERPAAVITFEQFGWYGHPDHVKTYRAVRRAFELLPEDARPALYCTVFAAEAMRWFAQLLREAGQEVPRMFTDRERMRYGLDIIPIVVDTSAQAAQKLAALNEHRTQMGPDGIQGRFPADIVELRASREYFMPAAHHDALPVLLPFERSGGLFGEPPPEPLVLYPILPPSPEELEADVAIAADGGQDA